MKFEKCFMCDCPEIAHSIEERCYICGEKCDAKSRDSGLCQECGHSRLLHINGKCNACGEQC
jgi:hypothetical protein